MESKPDCYEFLDHTADAKFKAWGKNLSELFANAAEACFAIITHPAKVKAKQRHEIRLKATNKEAALFDFLDQLLFLLDTEGFLLHACEKLRVTRNCDNTYWVTCEVVGDYHKGYEVSGNVKAVTYNEMYIKHLEEGGWEAQVVVDL